MTEHTHTPGPWYVDGPEGIEALVPDSAVRAVSNRGKGPRLETIATLPLGDGGAFGLRWFGVPNQERVANAALMAAAPDIFMALEALVDAHDQEPPMLTEQEWQAAREAIQKARGSFV